MNLNQFLDNAVKKTPNSLFLTREKITYSGFQENVKKRAVSLRNIGVKSGDVVGILSHNIPEFPTTLFAVWYLGASCLLLDTNLTSFEYDNMADLTKCKLVCAEKSFFYETDKFKFYNITDTDIVDISNLFSADVVPTNIATLSFTSGSTGHPKIVPLTHFNIIHCANGIQDMAQWIKPGDTFYGFLPMYHVFGFAVEILAAIRFNANVLLQPNVNPTEILADFKEYRPQIIPAVPRLWEVFRNKIIDNIKSKRKWWLVSFVMKNQNFLKFIGLGGLVKKIQKPVLEVFGGRARLLIAGGAATKPEVETFYEQLGLTFIQGYGLTETVGPICISKPNKKRFPFSFGGPMGSNECEIRDKNEDGVGVLWVRGCQVFGGYVNNESANAEVFDERGFFNTGDLVTIDSNGELHFAGRKKQVIVLDSGKNVYPDELEAMFLILPGVKNVAVFEHKIKGKTLSYAVFQVEDGITIDVLSKQIMDANKKVASYKWVTHFAITNEDLPLTSTQKVKHHVIRQNLIDGKYPIRKE